MNYTAKDYENLRKARAAASGGSTASTIGTAANAAGTAANLGGMFAGLKDWGSKAFPNAKKELGGILGGKGALAPEGFDWNSKTGVKAFGKNVGKGLNWLSAINQGVQTAQGISNYTDAVQSNEDLLQAIRRSALANPLLSSYLTSDQLALLRQIRSGNYDVNGDFSDFLGGMGSGLGDAALAALMGFGTGGWWGAGINGIGTLINSGIEGLAGGTSSAELEALYQTLMDAEAQYRSMKRPNFTGLGIQQQYQNMYA